MKAIKIDGTGTVEGLHIAEVNNPVTGNDQLKIEVKAAGINRADTLQRIGKYPPPDGVSDIMGLEVSGIVVEVGRGVDKFKIGDPVMALLAGGGYAEYAIANQGSVMPIPKNMDFIKAAGISEVFLTAFQAISLLGNLKKGQSILIHAGASGVGTAAIQLAKEMGTQVFITAGTDDKIQFCRALGADFGINYRKEKNFDKLVREHTNNLGVDLILDFIGAEYMAKNIDALAVDGRIILLAFLSGAKVDGINLAKILTKRISIIGSTLRGRSNTYKAALVDGFSQYLPLFDEQKFKPIIDSVFPWEKVGEAHQRIEQNLNIGKIILKVG